MNQTTTRFRVGIKKFSLSSMRADLVFELELIPCPHDKKLELTHETEISLKLENEATHANYVNTSVFVDKNTDYRSIKATFFSNQEEVRYPFPFELHWSVEGSSEESGVLDITPSSVSLDWKPFKVLAAGQDIENKIKILNCSLASLLGANELNIDFIPWEKSTMIDKSAKAALFIVQIEKNKGTRDFDPTAESTPNDIVAKMQTYVQAAIKHNIIPTFLLYHWSSPDKEEIKKDITDFKWLIYKAFNTFSYVYTLQLKNVNTTPRAAEALEFLLSIREAAEKSVYSRLNDDDDSE